MMVTLKIGRRIRIIGCTWSEHIDVEMEKMPELTTAKIEWDGPQWPLLTLACIHHPELVRPDVFHQVRRLAEGMYGDPHTITGTECDKVLAEAARLGLGKGPVLGGQNEEAGRRMTITVELGGRRIEIRGWCWWPFVEAWVDGRRRGDVLPTANWDHDWEFSECIPVLHLPGGTTMSYALAHGAAAKMFRKYAHEMTGEECDAAILSRLWRERGWGGIGLGRTARTRAENRDVLGPQSRAAITAIKEGLDRAGWPSSSVEMLLLLGLTGSAGKGTHQRITNAVWYDDLLAVQSRADNLVLDMHRGQLDQRLQGQIRSQLCWPVARSVRPGRTVSW